MIGPASRVTLEFERCGGSCDNPKCYTWLCVDEQRLDQVCDRFRDWFSYTYPDGVAAGQLYAEITQPKWIAWLIEEICEDIELRAQLPAHLSNGGADFEDNSSQCDAIRAAVPFERVAAAAAKRISDNED